MKDSGKIKTVNHHQPKGRIYKEQSSHDRDINAAKMIAQQAACRLGAEGGEGSGRLRFAVRVARPVKRGGLEINHFTDLIS